MKTHDLREMEVGRLVNHKQTLRSEYASLLEDVRSGKEKNHAQLTAMRRMLARVQTVLHEKESLKKLDK